MPVFGEERGWWYAGVAVGKIKQRRNDIAIEVAVPTSESSSKSLTRSRRTSETQTSWFESSDPKK